jgi:ABC-type glycerol-3-phosphate transport system substrate-binding protein
MISTPRHARALTLAAGAVAFGLVVTGCSAGGGSSDSSQTKGVTIRVALAADSVPKAALAQFTKETGITVKWSNIDWDSLQTKITAAATAKTYFADATNVDWSRVGQLGQLNWFYPLEDYIDTKSLDKEMPQIASFKSDGHVVGLPYDASFMVTTVNTGMFTKAGVTTMPTTMDQYMKDLEQIKQSGVSASPLNIPFAAAEGLSTYWYQATGAFGGTILDGKGTPQFTSPDSAGYKAATWMIDAYKKGLVPQGNINTSDSQGQQTLMAKGIVASTFSDYSGNVGTLYNVPDSSTVVDQVNYLATPGVDGAGPNLNNPDGVGIPRMAKYPKAAAKFITWFTSAKNQADFAGVNGVNKVWSGYTLPSRLSVVKQLTNNGKLTGGAQLQAMLADSAQPVFPEGAPAWYPTFSRAVYTNLHQAATGSITVPQAIKAIAQTAREQSAK